MKRNIMYILTEAIMTVAIMVALVWFTNEIVIGTWSVRMSDVACYAIIAGGTGLASMIHRFVWNLCENIRLFQKRA